MSRLATEYLQKQCSLPRQVTHLEADLANGYLFISLLNQMGHVSEESYELASDIVNPDAVLENFRILARSLRKLNISLTKKDVANIVSETPGAAADLVMKIRASREAQVNGKPLNAPPKYKDIMKSLRPKEFVRQTASTSKDTTSKELFFNDARTVLDRGVFAELEAKCLLESFKLQEFETIKTAIAKESAQHAANMTRRQEFHDATVSFRHSVSSRNAEKDKAITERWAVTEEDKRKRQVRDLQFELATLKIDELRRKKKSYSHRQDQIAGIDAFEVNMKRNGIGGGDDGQTLTTTYEDTELFSERLNSVAKAKWPTDDDTNDFVTALKNRTQDNRVARYEKARRKRRAMLVEQSAKAERVESSDEAKETAEATLRQESLLKDTLKQEHLQKILAEGALRREAILMTAEEKIRELSATFTNRAAEIEAERRAALKAIVDLRETKKIEKRRNNEILVRSIVTEIVVDIFDVGSEQKKGPSLCATDSHLLITQLCDMARQRIENKVSLEGVTSLDSWPSHAALAMNIGKWNHRSLSSTNSNSGDSSIQIFRQESYLEIAQTVLENFSQRYQEMQDVSSSGKSASSDIPLNLSEDCKNVLRSSGSKVVVALSNGCSPSRDAWLQMQSWSGECVCLWDLVSVVLVATKLKPLLEGKKPTISFTSLVQIFTEGKILCPSSLSGTTLTAEILKSCNELVELSDKILAVRDLLAAGPDLSLSSLTYTDVGCAIALGVSLRVRQFVREKLVAVEGIDAAMPSFVVVARLFGSIYACDNAVTARIIDWFLQGGTRDDIPETEKELLDAIASDGGNKGAKKAPPKKGAEVSTPEPAIAAIIWVHAAAHNSVKNVLKPDHHSEGFIDANQVIYFLSCVDAAKSKLNLPLNLAAVEQYLLMYGLSIAEGAESRAPGEYPTKVPIYSVRYSQLPACDGIISTKYIDSHLHAFEDLSMAETVLSIVLDLHHVHFDFAPINSTALSGSIAISRNATERVTHIKTVRRSQLSPQDKIWLLHVTKEKVLDPSIVFNTHAKICEARSLELELRGVLILIASYSYAEVERAKRAQQTNFIVSLKSSDKRWFDKCEHALQLLNTCSQDKEYLVFEDLVTGLGNIIDDRHMTWLSKLSQLEESCAGVILDLQTRLLTVADLYAKATFDILESQKAAAMSMTQLLETARYSSVPWLENEFKPSPENVQRLNARVGEFFGSCVSNDSKSFPDRTLWSDLAYMELPAGTDIRSVSMGILHQEAISDCLALMNTVHKSLCEARSVNLDSVNNMKTYCKRRYKYEHEVLLDWGSQLRGMVTKPDTVSGKQFLQQYYFGVSDDVLNDQIPSFNGQNAVEVGDMQLALPVLSALSEEISLTIFPKPMLSRNGTKDEASTSNPAAPIIEKRVSVLDAVIDVVISAVKKAVLKGVQVPRSWKNSKRVSSFLANFVNKNTDVENANTFQNVSTAIREMILSLIFAAVPSAIPLDYIFRLAKCLGKVTGNSDLVDISSISEYSFSPESLIQKVKADPKLSSGWGELPTAPLKLKEAQESAANVIASISWACVDESGNLHLPTFLLSFCKCPYMHLQTKFERALLFVDDEVEGHGSPLLSDGLYRAVRLASQIYIDDVAGNQNDYASAPDVVLSDGAVQLDALLGSRVSLGQLNWLNQLCNGKNVVADRDNFCSQIGICKRENFLENEGGNAVWDLVSVIPSGKFFQISGAWFLLTTGQLRSQQFSVQKNYVS